MCHVEVLELDEQLLPLLNGHEAELLVGPLGRHDGVVDILLGAHGDGPQLLASGGVHTVVLLLGWALLAVDDVVELVKLDAGNFGGRHDDREGFEGFMIWYEGWT